MTTVLVHGVPEDLHIWDELRAALGRDSIALGLPGFGGPRPAGFTATKEAYLAWLVDELARVPGPIDLVGHDWGGILTTRLGFTRPDLIRSFAADSIGFMHPEFKWHDLARIWATPGAGEKYMAEQAAAPIERRVGVLVQFGVAEPYARRMAEPNPVRDQCILDLYRSATQIQAEWGAGVQPTTKPALHLMGDKDPFGAPSKSVPFAESLGMRTKLLANTGHFWPSQAPALGAAALREFWDSL
jgi:pimeloyl-ACP methyl ester carboxylesterase